MPRKERNRSRFERVVAAGKLTKAKREAKRNKPRSDIFGTRPPTREPVLTPELATEYVQLLHAGLPPFTALAYFAPDHYGHLDDPQRKAWLTRWVNSPLMARAAATLNGGDWHRLEHEQRLDLAFTKAMSEMAYFLYTNTYQDCVLPADRDRWTQAREAIASWLAKNEGDEDSPMLRALRDIIEGKAGTGPPVLQMEQVLPQPAAKTKES